VSLRLGSSPRTGEAARAPGNRWKPLLATALVLVVVAGAISLFAVPAVAPHASPGSIPAPRAATRDVTAPAVTPDQTTHGDLVVTAGETFTIGAGKANKANPNYFQGGNITVDAGGTLLVENTNLSFVQYIGSSGTPQQRVAHVYTFANYGTVDVYNATITTDLYVLNAFAKLNLVDYGSMNLWNSSTKFPGWIQVVGATAELTLNSSTVEANPEVATAIEPFAIIGDTSYAASVYVLDGASLYLFNSSLTDTYADNTLIFGTPGPAPLTYGQLDLTGTPVSQQLATATDSANLTLDYLYYPHGNGIAAGFGVSSAFVEANYNDSVSDSNYTATVSYMGNTYSAGVLHFAGMSSGATVASQVSGGFLSAIDSTGLLAYLNQTCSFGTTPCGMDLNLTHLSGGTVVNISEVEVVLYPSLNYNMIANDSRVVSVDSSIGLTFGDTPSGPNSKAQPYPWTSNKFLFDNTSTAYLANLTVPSAIEGVFSPSALLPDATSVVNLYRWAEFNITNTSQGVKGPVDGVVVTAYYSYNSDQLSNATASSLNNISGLNIPEFLGYVNFWDGLHGVLKYGVSNATGKASLLLASTQIDTSTTLPDGYYLGGYHVDLHGPFVAGPTWKYFAVKSYPNGVALGTPDYGVADYVTIQVPLPPPTVALSQLTGPTGAGIPLNLNDQYDTLGIVTINGPGLATIYVNATPVGSAIGGGSTVAVALGTSVNGSFVLVWNSLTNVLTPGTSYQISASATYKTAATGPITIGTWSVPATTSATGFLFEKFLGLPFWIWIAILAAVVVGILVALLFFRRQAAGKLVECGECGELIPEDATVCPKCGAQFETELVRCSRCSSTIPANSQYCPECGAQLLGKPGEGASDPERQAYADFTERFRAEAKKELGDNYTESAFWDWWKRQPTYVPFSQWKLQQTKGAPRSGMSAPPAGSESVVPESTAAGAGAPLPSGTAPQPAIAAGVGVPPPATAPAAGAAAAGPAPAGLRPCPNCGKEIPPEYLVCPFCGAVTQ